MLKYEDFLMRCPWRLGDQSEYLYCQCRKRWVLVTPEEQVRQYALYVLESLEHPLSRMAVERSFEYMGRTKRIDILVYDQQMRPFLLVECKRADEQMKEEHLQQLLRYNVYWQAPYVALFNGHRCYSLARNSSEKLVSSGHFPSVPS